MAEASGARLFVLGGPDLGRSFPLGERTTLGRSDECGIVLRDRSISRKHARLVVEGGRWFAEDLGSTNGISKDGQRAQRIELADGDEFKLGDLPLRLRLGTTAEPSSAGLEIEFDVGPTPARASRPPPPPGREPAPAPAAGEEITIEEEIHLEEAGAAPAARPRPTLAPSTPPPPRAARRTGLFAADLEQLPFGVRALIVLLLLALGLALAYGAFRAMGLLRAD